MLNDVAMQDPIAGVLRDESQCHGGLGVEEDGVGKAAGAAADAEGVAVGMEGVGVLRLSREAEDEALPEFQRRDWGGRDIGCHCARPGG